MSDSDRDRSRSGDRFWESTPLSRMTRGQWESLCDGCGKCCLEKFEDEDSGDIIYSRVACALLDLETCQCRDYANRARRMPECVTLDPAELERAKWLPETCAYRLLAENRPLPAWHPLISGDPDSVARAGQTLRGRAISPGPDTDPLQHLIDWVR
ncbi:MAG: YcgN family cysteine cluster protein [Thiocapsa sp.]|nr:YcgN family cysteine cluster protein [Thiocapsa sp.]MCG6898251.1 YcgN family cysteine cluster protein [Thiocapsa sp.]MCG6984395.1 YcgN family cysteine cluster protein [Thiocapsa sp.]